MLHLFSVLCCFVFVRKKELFKKNVNEYLDKSSCYIDFIANQCL